MPWSSVRPPMILAQLNNKPLWMFIVSILCRNHHISVDFFLAYKLCASVATWFNWNFFSEQIHPRSSKHQSPWRPIKAKKSPWHVWLMEIQWKSFGFTIQLIGYVSSAWFISSLRNSNVILRSIVIIIRQYCYKIFKEVNYNQSSVKLNLKFWGVSP